MGAHFRLPILEIGWQDIKTRLELGGLECYLAATKDGIRYDRADLRHPLALIIGGEASGAPPDAVKLVRQRLYIPMSIGSESLNAAAAAAIILFEIVQQRGNQA